MSKLVVLECHDGAVDQGISEHQYQQEQSRKEKQIGFPLPSLNMAHYRTVLSAEMPADIKHTRSAQRSYTYQIKSEYSHLSFFLSYHLIRVNKLQGCGYPCSQEQSED